MYLVVSGDHKGAAPPRGSRGDDHKQAARSAARRHGGAEHHRAEPHQQGVEEHRGR